MDNIANNIRQIKVLLEEFSINSHRNSDTVKVLAVSKGQGAEKLLAAWHAGIQCFGENYLQEALEKITTLSDINPEWHFIGPVQSNKTKDIARHFSWVHTVDRIRVATRLSEHRQGVAQPLNICIQVNIDSEAGKSGVEPHAILDLANTICELPNLRLRGLMVLPRPRTGFAAERQPFRRVAQLLEELKSNIPQFESLDTLSMGMSNDWAAAIHEGATIVRIGTGIFGPRQTRALKE
ncbi:MAG: YggS family pyridoxal phosphate-dependent enzyme [Gammaproteobacteria bacterium]|nr:MAG: YggS family pyridoxal phosphate-dependent enzyme [Gammaproteobacteria bacterium]RLA50575.1 MAG: YggS family pyridoxal phosphate-dependent enzyme [Gammaproteobacteria bacterium]